MGQTTARGVVIHHRVNHRTRWRWLLGRFLLAGLRHSFGDDGRTLFLSEENGVISCVYIYHIRQQHYTGGSI